MKKIGIFLLIFIFMLTATGCKKRDESTHKIILRDPEGLVINALDGLYKAGTVIEVKYNRKLNYQCGVTVDGKNIKSKNYILTGESVAKFIMPNHDCVVEIYTNDEEVNQLIY